MRGAKDAKDQDHLPADHRREHAGKTVASGRKALSDLGALGV
jgi:hypothetical protein